MIAPDDAALPEFGQALEHAFSRAEVSALLLPQGDRSEADYRALVSAVSPIAQNAGCAVLLDNRPDLVAALAADGVHITGGIQAVREAVAGLKPDYIVGAGDIGSRHEAMMRGELEIDYLLFGDRNDTPEGHEMAQWWAETFEIPCVHVPAPGGPVALAAEFLGLSPAEWTAPGRLDAHLDALKP